MEYVAAYGQTIVIEGWGERDCGADDGRTGMVIVHGRVTQDGDSYDGWLYLHELQYAIPTMAQMIARIKDR